MLYFHCRKTQMISCLDENPKVVTHKNRKWLFSWGAKRVRYSESSGKKGKELFLESVDLEPIRGEQPTSDSEETATKHFRMNNYPEGDQISSEEYKQILDRIQSKSVEL